MGKITKMLLDKWSENVGVDIIAQIKMWDEELKIYKGPTPYQFEVSD